MPLSSIPFPTAAIAGAAAATLASMAYLDAKFSLRSDLEYLWGRKLAMRELGKTAAAGRASFFYLFEDAVNSNPHGEAIWSRDESLSYTQAYHLVLQYAQWFLARGVQPGDRVVLYMANSPDFMLAWLGLTAVGASPALVNINLASRPLVHCIQLAKAKLVVGDGDDELLGRLEEVRDELETSGHQIARLRDVKKGEILSLLALRPDDELRKTQTMASPLALAYTSGTTGLPKAMSVPVAIGHGSTFARRYGYQHIRAGKQRSYNCMPYCHLTGGLSALQTLAVGDTLCVAPKFSARGFWADIRASRATFFVYVGETLRYLLAQPPSPLDRAHGVHSIFGNGLRADVWVPFRERFGIETIYEFYNSTEAMFGLVNACRGDFTATAVGLYGGLLRRLTRLHIVAVQVDAETGDLLRDSKTGFARRAAWEVGGEVLVKLEPGSGVPGREFRGYWDNEAATAKKLARDVFEQGDCYYRTGDALRRDSEGRWFFGDRLGDTFRWKGENVSTTEVADLVGGFPGVVEANVYGVQLPGHDGRAGAVALLVQDATRFDFAGFLQHCRSRLPKYAVPIFVRLGRASYSTGNYKQNKVPLKTQGVDPAKISGGDALYWIDGHGKGDTYVPFTRDDWETLHRGKARL